MDPVIFLLKCKDILKLTEEVNKEMILYVSDLSGFQITSYNVEEFCNFAKKYGADITVGERNSEEYKWYLLTEIEGITFFCIQLHVSKKEIAKYNMTIGDVGVF